MLWVHTLNTGAVLLLGEHKLNTESGPRFPTQRKGQVWSELYTFNSSTEKKIFKDKYLVFKVFV